MGRALSSTDNYALELIMFGLGIIGTILLIIIILWLLGVIG